MGQGDLGIINLEEPEGAQVRVTDMERTLVDIVIRPVYSGGVSNVLAAYRKARGKVSIGRLTEMLKALDFA
jgi:predicted transcriptional regulator of viral defense system